MSDDNKERLQKFLARAGIASRRASEALIEAGRVRVNGKVVTELGTKIDPRTDKVEFDGETVSADHRHVYLLLNKPQGVISAASDPEGRPVVTSLIPDEYGRTFPVGRLDWDSEGAILMTDDGELAQLVTHPRHEVTKTYMVKVTGLIGDKDHRIDALREGVKLDDGRKTLPAEVIRDSDTGKHTWFVVSIREGRNRQIRRMFEAVGIDVRRLRRIAYGPVSMGDVPPGEFRRLSEEEIDELYDAAGGKRPRFSASRGRLPQHKRSAIKRRAAQAKRDAPPSKDARPHREKPGRDGKPSRDSKGRGPGRPSRDGGRPSRDGGRPSRDGGRPSRDGGRPPKKGRGRK